jgi:hypothetical protein
MTSASAALVLAHRQAHPVVAPHDRIPDAETRRRASASATMDGARR